MKRFTRFLKVSRVQKCVIEIRTNVQNRSRSMLARTQSVECCADGETLLASAWPRTQQTVNLSSTEAELYALTTANGDRAVSDETSIEEAPVTMLTLLRHVDQRPAATDPLTFTLTPSGTVL